MSVKGLKTMIKTNIKKIQVKNLTSGQTISPNAAGIDSIQKKTALKTLITPVSRSTSKSMIKLIAARKIIDIDKDGTGGNPGNTGGSNSAGGSNNVTGANCTGGNNEGNASDDNDSSDDADNDLIDIEFDADPLHDSSQTTRDNNLADDTDDMDRILLQSQRNVLFSDNDEKESIPSKKKKTALPGIRSKLKGLEYDTSTNDGTSQSDVGTSEADVDQDQDQDVDVDVDVDDLGNNSSIHGINIADVDTDNEQDIRSETRVIRSAKKPMARKKPLAKKSITAVKKGPGRPRKVPKKEPIPRQGISKQPSSDDANMEVLYDSPMILRKLVAFFKSIAAAQIQLLFRPTDIIMFAQDHIKKSKAYVRIDGSKLNYYYCKSKLDIGVSSKELERIINTVDKDYGSIIFLSSAGNTQKNITIILENEMQINEQYTIDVVGQYPHMDNEHEFLDEDYMIQFEWPGKYFRKKVNDVKTFSNTFSVTQENADSPLEIGFVSANKKVRARHIVKNQDKIKLKSKLTNDDSFRVDVNVDYIRPISSAHIADDVTILVDENKKIMTKAYIDGGTIEIKTLTEIIDDRPKDE